MAVIDSEVTPFSFNLAGSLVTVTRQHGKPSMAQVAELTKLAFGVGKITPEEYYQFHLYDDALSLEEKKTFLGRKSQTKILVACIPQQWWAVSHDKLLFYGLLKGLGHSVPTTQAVFHPFRRYGDTPTLGSADDLANFLRHDARYPCFGKPVCGIRSVGVASLEGYEPGDDSLRTQEGRSLPLKAFIPAVQEHFKDGYVFQDRLEPHTEIKALCGERIATIRLVVLLKDDAGPEILHALWKIPAGDNIADNFWRQGNVLASLDIETGRVRRALRGTGLQEEALSVHPDSERQLVDSVVPCWDEVKARCLDCAAALPGLTLQAWDISVGPEGPVMVEVNIGGDFNLPQIASRQGLLQGDFRAFVARHVKLK